jgi:predicted TIM-barrel fold metal-dependent hydrolase
MTAIDTSTAAGGQQRFSTETLLIDTDVHERPPQGLTMLDLVPYMDPVWARFVTRTDGGEWTGFPKLGGYIAPVAKNGVREDWNYEGNVQGGGVSIEKMREHLIEGEGVSTPIINGPLFYPTVFPGDPDFVCALASAYNDWQIENWLEKEPQLRGSVHVHGNLPDWSAKEIDRVAAHPQVVQVILPLVTTVQWGDPFYRPIWEAALRNDLAIAFHHANQTNTLLGWPRYFIEWHTMAAPQAAQNQVMSLIVNGTFDKYPDLKVVMLESGVTWIHWLMWRLDQQYRELRTNIPWVKRLPSEHIRSNVKVATQPITEVTPGEFQALVEMTETQDVFVFASDYPHYDADSADTVLAALPDELRFKIRWRNALDAYPRLAGLAPTDGDR